MSWNRVKEIVTLKTIYCNDLRWKKKELFAALVAQVWAVPLWLRMARLYCVTLQINQIVFEYFTKCCTNKM